MTLLVLYILLAIGVSFVCSVLEAVLLSVTPAYIGVLEKERPRAAERLRKLKADIDRPLATILSLNTIAHTIGAAGAGAQAASVFGSAWIGVFSAVLTLAILVLSEIIPKTLGAVYWRELAPGTSRVLAVLIRVLIPFVWLSQWITRLIAPGSKSESVSRDELVALATLGAEQGVVQRREARILKNLMRFNELTAQDIMTPRTVLFAAPETSSVSALVERQPFFSRIPIYDDDLDQVTGYVLKDAVLERLSAGLPETKLLEIRREILAVPHKLSLPELFDRLLERREHIALVVGKFGGTAGVVTMEDVIETLLGLEIVDEVDENMDMQQVARERWAERAAKMGITIPEP